MSKITSPLQALNVIRDLCDNTPPGTLPGRAYERLHAAVREAAILGIARAVPLPAPYRKAACNLVPGDVLVFGVSRAVVTLVASDFSDHVSISSVVLGVDEPVRVNLYPCASQLTVEAPAGLTPVQAAADKLLPYARAYLDCAINPRVPSMSREEGEALSVMLDELDPPKPPTLEEALRALERVTLALRPFGSAGRPGSAVMQQREAALAHADSLLKRVPN